jgi:ribosomal protein S18 acetylase RimI-like enzyme
MARVHIDSWRAAYRGLVPESFLESLDYARRAEGFRGFLVEHSGDTYAVAQAGKTIGFLTIGACRDADVDQEVAGEIWGIYLAPGYWRRGIGRQLCRRAEELLRAQGYVQATLWVFEGNEAARRFYEAMGFVPDGADKMLELGAPLRAVRYHKKLGDAPAGGQGLAS